MSAPDAVESLLAIEALKRLKARFFRCLDDRDYDEMRTLFTEDAVIGTTTGRHFDGIDSFLAFLGDPANRPARTVHHGHLPEIEIISPTTATGTWALHAYAEFADHGDPRSTHRFGRYRDEYRKQGGAWKIAAQRVELLPAPD
jgi:ketosteroid isomerase-like protein